MREALQTRKVNLLSLNRDVRGIFEIVLPIDSQLEEFTVQVSGGQPSVTVIDASGVEINERTYGSRYKNLLNIQDAYTVFIKDPEPGMWRMKISAESAHTIRITGERKEVHVLLLSYHDWNAVMRSCCANLLSNCEQVLMA